MARLELIFVFALLFEVESNSREALYRFYHPDEDVSLPCGTQNRPEQCSRISWLYSRDLSKSFTEAKGGKIEEKSPRADRLSLNTDCSLDIKLITAEDVGVYTCRLDNNDYYDVNVYLSVLTVSQLPADSDQTRNSEVTLECSLLRYDGLPRCRSNGLRWVDETGTEVTEGVNKFSRNADCISHLKVKTESGNNRKLTCQFVQEDKVEIQADFTPVLTDPTTRNPRSNPGQKTDFKFDQTFIIVGVLVGVVFLLVVMAAVLIKYKKRPKVTEDVQTPSQQPDEPVSDLTYVTVSHSKQQKSFKKAKNEEEVTYSTVKSSVRNEAYDDHSNVYSNVSNLK